MSSSESKVSLYPVLAALRENRWVDLTHEFDSDIPHWPGVPDMQREILYSLKPGEGKLGTGMFIEMFHHVGQWGTHCDPPAHFAPGLRTLDQIDVKEMFLPLVVIDCHEQVALNPNYCISLSDISAWEAKFGLIPSGSFVAFRTDWSKRWPDTQKMRNEDSSGVAHYPGWSLEVLQLLYLERGVIATGHEMTDTDPGVATSANDYQLERFVLSTNHYQIELMTNLDQVPEYGALVVSSFPKLKSGSGFPARLFAILPQN